VARDAPLPITGFERLRHLANPELGAKQICPNCQAKFYDLTRRPAHCPKCETEFDPEEVVRTRRVRSRSVVPDYESDDEKPVVVAEADGFEDEVDETPEIDQAIAADVIEVDDDTDPDPAAGPAAPADDLGVDFAEDEDIADDDDVPFLEEEDDDFNEDDIEGLPGEDDRDT
jgi:uncharacterized protein (TIGR02300 family)